MAERIPGFVLHPPVQPEVTDTNQQVGVRIVRDGSVGGDQDQNEAKRRDKYINDEMSG